MRALALGLLVLLAGCLPNLQRVNPEQPPSPENWGPNPVPLEWWYVSAYLPQEGLAFHWAMFKAYAPQNYRIGLFQPALFFPGPYHASHLAVTDLNTGRITFQERFDFRTDRPQGDSLTSYPPLRLEQGDWKLLQEGDHYILSAGPIQLRLTPSKPAVVHPPGYSGTAETGRMYYISYTRMRLEGHILGRRVQGEAWMDHQWGDQIGGNSLGALWDWFGLHLSDGQDLMLYRVKNPKGQVVQLAGSLVDASGQAHEVEGLEMTPLDTWTSPSGRTYALSWQIQAQDLSLKLDPLRQNQELLTRSTGVAYWEGPVQGSGTFKGRAIQATGMGEFVAGPYNPSGSPFITPLPDPGSP
ncbi:lipocalin family protein [Meiothermus granaticius]|uniref:Lipocalin-like domain protein n=1 Tax=Meiothermus granaticius NBRC 107808 TaxID=1227551 RepID=A0A399F9I7_9DEIN|nr:lipocalin family protein [Meiothermus granaticius]RIH92355.1 Lipocalin-like domain protein [Meiothermus granaticius NBRC 107808]GEM87101.1 hypothetical protein MGR01S_17260 [Meiothermus granaticius NBRC 107808]